MRPEQLASGGFVQAWSTRTGEEQWVPAHFFDSPVTSRGLTRKNPNPSPEEAPSLGWTRGQLDTYAADRLHIDTTGEKNKADALTAIQAATPEPVDDLPTPDDPQTQQQHDTDSDTETPAAGENQE